MNMNVTNKSNGKKYDVYDVTYDKAGYPHFLIYKDGQWVRMSAKYFRPYNLEDITREATEMLDNMDSLSLTVF